MKKYNVIRSFSFLPLLLLLACRQTSAQKTPTPIPHFPTDVYSRYDNVYKLLSGYAGVTKDKKHGVIDSTGKEIIPLHYDYILYRQDLPGFELSVHDSIGLADLRGRILVPPIYRHIHEFQDRRALIETKDMNYMGDLGFIDPQGRVVIPPAGRLVFDFEDGAAVVCDPRYGAIDTSGKVIIPCKYASACGHHEGLFCFMNDSTKEGFLDRAGKVIIPFVYDQARPFHDGLAIVKKSDRWGLVDKKGVERIPVIYEMVDDKSEGLILVKKNGKYGFVNDKNQIVIPFEYDNAFSFENGAARVRKDGVAYRIDKKNNREDVYKQTFP